MPNVRLMPPAAGPATARITVNGRSYSCAIGGTIDVPDFDAGAMRANGWVEAAAAVGATAARPTNPRLGQDFHDTSLNKNIRWDGKTWRDPATGTAV